MQKGQLLPALLSNDKHGIAEIKNLGYVENVQDEGKRGVGVVERVAGDNGIVILVGLHRRLNAHVRAEHDLNNVVEKFEWVQARDGGKSRHHDLQHVRDEVK